MSSLSYAPANDEEIFRLCTKEVGIITATEDQQYFALGCLYCAEKFLYFDAFIGHMQTEHGAMGPKGIFGGGMFDGAASHNLDEDGDDEEDLTDADPALLEPQMVMIKEELMDEQLNDDDLLITGLPMANEMADVAESLYNDVVKQELDMDMDEHGYMKNESYGSYDDYGEDDEPSYHCKEEDGSNYDDLVEQSLLGGVSTSLTMHIKDRKMIQFLIGSYRQNPFLWDHLHPQFRDRGKRQQFLDWIIMEFKRRFNLSLAKDAITRKWDNLRTVYKRECNRMSLEKSNISTLWYFKELHFLNRLYGGNQKMSEAVVKETIYRRRYSALWNDVSTSKLLAMVQQYPCFYDKMYIDYRSKEKRGEALAAMAVELQKMIDVTTIQISKRISQLRFDYSKQKQERLQCEQSNKVFVPSYTYYDQMLFMDADVAPFKCDYCLLILQTPRELEQHLLQSHHPPPLGFVCSVCNMTFAEVGELARHRQQVHAPPALKEVKFFCDLCTASFREKTNFDEHMRRHNEELLLPTLGNSRGGDGGGGGSSSSASSNSADASYPCDICGKMFVNMDYLNAHRVLHTNTSQHFQCEYPQCRKVFSARQHMIEHCKQHYGEDEHRCEICGKGFKSVKNLQNHRQIHDAVKRYVCKICGSAFAQAAGLYLHKRRHNRPHPSTRQSY